MLDLPDDLVEEILCRVPATSLKQLRYTCKRWNSLWNTRRFIRKHSYKAAKQNLVLMLKDYKVCLMSVNVHGVPSVKVTVEVNLLDPRSNLDPFKISTMSHCDGLLLFINKDYTKIVVWNPCTGQSRWIPPRKTCDSYALGSYQYNKYGDHSYKILSYSDYDSDDGGFQIYEINSNLWRTLDVTMDCVFEFNDWGMYLKGKTYWFASDEKEKQLGIFLVSFDYTTERFERLLLPCQCPSYKDASLSVVREEKLSVLLQHENSLRTEIWVTNKIDETELLSWSKVLTVDLEHDFSSVISFLVDEEKKVLVYCDVNIDDDDDKHMVYIVGEDNKVKPLNFGITDSDSEPFLFNYVPSLTQIPQVRSKRKRGTKKKRKRNQV